MKQRKPHKPAGAPYILSAEDYTVDPVTGCWPWRWGCNGSGYAVVTHLGKTQRVNRITLGILDRPDLVQIHECDNPPCVNPEHIRPGSRRENVRDMMRKRRGLIGESHNQARYTDAEVAAAIARVAAGESQKSVAQDIGTSASIVNRWYHGLSRSK